MKTINKTKIVLAATLLFPFVTFAANNMTLKDLIAVIADYMDRILLLLMGFAVLAFVWYIFKYFIRENDNRTEAGQYVMYSLIGFFVILSLWGLVNILVNTFDLGTNSPGSWLDLHSIFPTN